MESPWARGPLKPFRHGQYRWLTAATALSLLADGMWMIATVWQVIDLDGGPKQLSLVAVGWSAGVVATTLVGGVLADRIPQRRIIVGVSLVRVLTASVVGIAAVAGLGEIWHLAVAGLVFGMTAGIFFPAYSAILPSIVDADDLLAANGIEGVLRPIMLQAAGPAAASVIVATISPGHAIVAVALAELACLLLLLGLRPVPLRRDLDAAEGHGVGHLLGDLREGFGYVARTPWLLATLLLATVLVMVSMGPIEVLLPFVIKDDLGGDATGHAHGTRLLCGNGVAALHGTGRVEAVELADGTVLPADLVVAGIGAIPNTEWLESSGVELDNGVVCDATLASSVPGVYAAGDVASWINPVFDRRQRLEHWTSAAEQGATAARNALDPANSTAYRTVPYFWSDWYDVRIQFVGTPQADEVVLVDGDPEAGERWIALYRAGDRLVGALTVNGQTEVMKYRGKILKGATWDDALAFAEQRKAARSVTTAG